VVNEKALIEALQDDMIAAAGLDVFEGEPLPLDPPLNKMEHKVLLSPHMVASNLYSGLLREGVVCVANAVPTVLNGEVPDNIFK